MTKNVGGIDKILRLVLGAALIGATALDVLPVWGYIGIVPVVTSLMGWCPLYPLFGFSSCPVKSND
jgi:glyoxylate carboligase